MEQLVIHDQTFEYTLKRSNRKSIAIEIGYDGVMIVRAPQRVPMCKIEELLEAKKEWIYSNLMKHSEQPPKDKNQVYYLGRCLDVKVEEHRSFSLGIHLEEGNLIIKKPEGYRVQVSSVLEQWYRKTALQLIRSKVECYSRLMGVSYQAITIKDQKTRWGSCSSKGNLNFNFRLIMAPEEVLDYVIVHELAHRIQMNHSKAFWDEVAKVIPEYRERRLWLKEHGHELRL